jgi:hypothetical protein
MMIIKKMLGLRYDLMFVPDEFCRSLQCAFKGLRVSPLSLVPIMTHDVTCSSQVILF